VCAPGGENFPFIREHGSREKPPSQSVGGYMCASLMYIKKAFAAAHRERRRRGKRHTQREAVKMRCWELSRGLLLLLSALFNSANQYHMLQHPLMVCSATWYIKSPLFYTRPAVCTSLLSLSLSLSPPLTHLLIYILMLCRRLPSAHNF
jgi:hypothetical protein